MSAPLERSSQIPGGACSSARRVRTCAGSQQRPRQRLCRQRYCNTADVEQTHQEAGEQDCASLTCCRLIGRAAVPPRRVHPVARRARRAPLPQEDCRRCAPQWSSMSQALLVGTSFIDFAMHWLVWRRAAGSCPLSSARTAGARRAGIAADAAASVLLMPRSLVVFAGAAYTEHLHGIDEVRLPRERSFMVCEQKCMPQCLYGVAGCISCRPAWRHTSGTVKRRCSAARMHAGLVALRI